jgi:hypothetical protein
MMILQQTRGLLSSNDQLALDLPFAETKSLAARIGPTPTFTRGSSATFVGSNGLIQTAASGVARFDHDPVTLASRGLLIEEGRTNLLVQSEDLSTTWTVNQLNTTGTPPYLNVETAPSGQTTADKIIANAASSTHQFRQSVTLVGGTAYTLSVYFKAAEQNFATFQVFGTSNGSANWVAFYRVAASAPSVGAFIGFSNISIEDAGNGWRRCIANFTATASGTLNVRIGSATGTSLGNDTFVGDNSSGIYAWGAQLEAGSFPTSYIPTTTSALARSADVCSITGADFTGMYSPLEGSLFTSAIFNAPVAYGISQFLVDINDTTAANRLRYYRLSNTGRPEFANTSNNSLNVQISVSTALPQLVIHKYSAGFKLDDYAFYVNNSQIGTDNLGAMVVSPTRLTIGDASAGASRQYTNGTISAIRYYKKRLPNQKLQALTA